MEENARRGIRSIEVAFRLLSALQQSTKPLPLKEIAARSRLTPSATNNYLVSLVRTGLASIGDRPGSYRLGPAALALGMSALNQLDGFEVARREAVILCDTTLLSSAVTTWSADGPISLFKQEREVRGAYEIRTGLIPLDSTAAGKVFIAYLTEEAIRPVLEMEWLGKSKNASARYFKEVRRELDSNGYAKIQRSDISGYASIAAPIWDWNGEVRFAISIVGSRDTLNTSSSSPHVKVLLESAARATKALGGISRNGTNKR